MSTLNFWHTNSCFSELFWFVLFLVRVSLYLAIVLFAPALALNAVVGIPEIATVLGAGMLL